MDFLEAMADVETFIQCEPSKGSSKRPNWENQRLKTIGYLVDLLYTCDLDDEEIARVKELRNRLGGNNRNKREKRSAQKMLEDALKRIEDREAQLDRYLEQFSRMNVVDDGEANSPTTAPGEVRGGEGEGEGVGDSGSGECAGAEPGDDGGEVGGDGAADDAAGGDGEASGGGADEAGGGAADGSGGDAGGTGTD